MGGELHPCFKVFSFIIITDGVVFKTFRVLAGVGMPFQVRSHWLGVHHL
ncbi:hypothetical protein MEG1DRAFT_01042 [Photorhabdus temperata subsp. temperata Meg1]|uniref:Uncharacterized protein n=2 Tax=Photorhabdus temperata TaxID=574560 RepID=A0A081S019_PHOTE|nr:hypothetical protein O185_03945 [Photorhabdus temperata J3]KER04272.1 hypothetical protein MEG1DRAFT_01042 [Photorhabdus temperata subsp. temperata Meg1]